MKLKKLFNIMKGEDYQVFLLFMLLKLY